MGKPEKNHPDSECQIHEILPWRHVEKVLQDYPISTRLKEIEKLADVVNKALPDRDLASSVNLWPEESIADTILHGLMGATVRFIQRPK